MKEPTPSKLFVFIVFSSLFALFKRSIRARFNSCSYFIFHINIANIFIIANKCRSQNSYNTIQTHQHAFNLYSI